MKWIGYFFLFVAGVCFFVLTSTIGNLLGTSLILRKLAGAFGLPDANADSDSDSKPNVPSNVVIT